PLMFGNDVIHGFETTYPIPLAISTTWNMDLVEESARMAAKEASSVGINWVFSPMVDICRDARWGRISEGGGEDPYLGGEIAKAYTRGYQGTDLSADNTVMVCVKHYALYGGAEAGRDYNSVFLSRQEALNGFMNPYKQAALVGAGSYMSSFNEFEGVPATINHYLLTELLRNQWGFKGFVVSDATAVNEVIAHGIGDQQEVSRRALQAGLDMDMGSNAFVATLKKSVDEGKVSVADIDLACRRILEAKYKLGLFADPYKYIIPGRDNKEIYNAEQLAFARKIAQESQVLLKNDNNVLPLKKNAKIALVGPFADNASEMQGAWAMSKHSNEFVTILQGVKEALQGGSVTSCEGSWIIKDKELEENIKYGLYKIFAPNMPTPPLHTTPQEDLIAEAVKLAQQADVVVACVGEINNMSGEGASRSDVSLPDAQEDLLKALKATGKPLVVVLTTGRPLILNWEAEHADAILNTWALGAEAGHAIADVLFGDVNPSGKLTTSFPRANGQLP
ncbi:MAG: glycoside hydrolase family 3 C-terminal domain-containing protein, partial [Bacteroidaceae bacterium]|nr:glycoside hydrolase family 3 C-terminal domain-containing protein [Bacteroidaceae bacterium]